MEKPRLLQMMREESHPIPSGALSETLFRESTDLKARPILWKIYSSGIAIELSFVIQLNNLCYWFCQHAKLQKLTTEKVCNLVLKTKLRLTQSFDSRGDCTHLL